MNTAKLIESAKAIVNAVSKAGACNPAQIHNLTELDGKLSDAQDRPCDNEEFMQIFEMREEIASALAIETSTFSFA